MIEVSYSVAQFMLLGNTRTSLLCALIVWSMHKKVSWIVYPWPYTFWGGSSKKGPVKSTAQIMSHLLFKMKIISIFLFKCRRA